jgi:hypothetical protein
MTPNWPVAISGPKPMDPSGGVCMIYRVTDYGIEVLRLTIIYNGKAFTQEWGNYE